MRRVLVVLLCLVSLSPAVGAVEWSNAQIARMWTESQQNLMTLHKLATTRPVDIARVNALATTLHNKWERTLQGVEVPGEDAETPTEFFGAYLQSTVYVYDILSTAPKGEFFPYLEDNAGAIDSGQREFIKWCSKRVAISKPLCTKWFAGAKAAITGKAIALPPSSKSWKRLDIRSFAVKCPGKPVNDSKVARRLLKEVRDKLGVCQTEVEVQTKRGSKINWPHYFRRLYVLWMTAKTATGYDQLIRATAEQAVIVQFNAWVRQSQTGEVDTGEAQASNDVYVYLMALLLAK